jgi:hypothetical protein
MPVPSLVAQGERYPLSLTEGNLRSKDGTVYSMPETRLGGVQRQRKELRAQKVLDAWWGDVLHPWQTTVTGEEEEDGMWLSVGANVTQEVCLWLVNGTLSLPLPLSDILGDPCPGRSKVLLLRYVDSRGQRREMAWQESLKTFHFLQTIQTTHSIRRLANIVAGDSPVEEAINGTAPLVTALRRQVDKQQRLLKRAEVRRLSNGGAGGDVRYGERGERGGPILSGPKVIGSTFELEARLGTWQWDGVRRGRGRFANGVSREFMDRVLALCEGWADWSPVGGWEEMHDYVGRVNQLQVRTTVRVNPKTVSG